MSNRDKQKKYDRENNVDSSIFARVNIGQNANNKFDSPNLTHTGGSRNNPDEQSHTIFNSSLAATLVYYVMGVIFTGIVAFLGLQLFHSYFYGDGMNKTFPSLILLVVSLLLGFSSAKFVTKKLTNKRSR